MDLSIFLNEVLWEFQRPDWICGATCFPMGHNLKPCSDRNLFPVEFFLGAELWFGVSSAWSWRLFWSQWNVAVHCRFLPARSPFSTQISVSIKHLELSQICLQWANVSKILKVRSIRTEWMPLFLGNRAIPSCTTCQGVGRWACVSGLIKIL